MINFFLLAFSGIVFAAYKILGNDIYNLGFGFSGDIVALLIAVAFWLIVSRLGNWKIYLLHSFLFTFCDGILRAYKFLYETNFLFSEIFNDAPIIYFLVVYFFQGVFVFILLLMLKKLPLFIDRILIFPAWIESIIENGRKT